jgi:hypothetical protein
MKRSVGFSISLCMGRCESAADAEDAPIEMTIQPRATARPTQWRTTLSTPPSQPEADAQSHRLLLYNRRGRLMQVTCARSSRRRHDDDVPVCRNAATGSLAFRADEGETACNSHGLRLCDWHTGARRARRCIPSLHGQIMWLPFGGDCRQNLSLPASVFAIVILSHHGKLSDGRRKHGKHLTRRVLLPGGKTRLRTRKGRRAPMEVLECTAPYWQLLRLNEVSCLVRKGEGSLRVESSMPWVR